MAEYIERKAAIKTAEHAYNEWNLAMAAADGKREINLVYKRQELCKAVASIFDSTPAADVAPVVHARWDDIPNAYMSVVSKTGTYHGNATTCSACREINPNAFKTNYCPNCGAKMDGGEGK